MSTGIGHRCSLVLALLWLWHRTAAVALIQPLAWEPSCVAGAALKSKQQQQQQQQNKPQIIHGWVTGKGKVRESPGRASQRVWNLCFEALESHGKRGYWVVFSPKGRFNPDLHTTPLRLPPAL